MDYCERPDEVAKNPEARMWLERIAAGNADAFAFMWTMWNWSHVIDDLVDRDKPTGVEDAAGWFIKMAHELSFNRFYVDNSAFLFGLVASMFNRWCDGEEWERSKDLKQRAASHVIKCGDIELYLGVAYLTGGWDHVRACRGARSYDSNGLELVHLQGAA